MDDSVLDWLAEPDNPSVRYLTLTTLLGKQPDGRWNLENTFNGKMRVRIESKGKPSKWITLKALQVLH